MGKYYIGIAGDDSPENPLDYSNYELISFNSRHSNFGHPEELGWFKNGPHPTPKLRKLMEKDLAFVLSYYEHGDCRWQLQDGPKIPGSECPWDSVRTAGLLIFTGALKDAPAKSQRAAAAQDLVSAYTDWSNGSVYEWFLEDKRGNTIDSLGGLFGLSYAEESLKEALAAMPPKKLKLSDSNEYLDSVPLDVWKTKDLRQMSEREICHMVAGLRMLRAVGNGPNGHTCTSQLFAAAELATDDGNHKLMSKEEIDELIEKIN